MGVHTLRILLAEVGCQNKEVREVDQPVAIQVAIWPRRDYTSVGKVVGREEEVGKVDFAVEVRVTHCCFNDCLR